MPTNVLTTRSKSGHLVLTRDERLLCSPNNPELEAQNWLRRQTILPEDQELVLLGLGAGHHLLSLRQNDPELLIHVIELDESTLQMMSEKFSADPKVRLLNAAGVQELARVVDGPVLCFRPAWAGQESAYLSLLSDLVQDQPEKLLQVAQQLGYHFNSDMIHLKARLLKPDAVASDESKIWRCLAELVA